MENNIVFLYLVVIGGKIPKANIELHDVRWVIGSKIEDTFDDLRNGWFGSMNGLHIDSYKKINSVDGYEVKIKKPQNKKLEINNNKSNDAKKLWFVNLGGYHPKSMQEKHEFGLVVAKTSSDAKKIAKSKWLNGFKKKHNDNLYCLQRFSIIDDCKLIKNINNWEIELTPDNKYFENTLSPDWYGYLRIDKK